MTFPEKSAEKSVKVFDEELSLTAHLMRRAGFGARRDELEEYVAQGYQATVEQLLQLDPASDLEQDVVERYYIDIDDMRSPDPTAGWWLYRMINTRRPLQEKLLAAMSCDQPQLSTTGRCRATSCNDRVPQNTIAATS